LKIKTGKVSFPSFKFFGTLGGKQKKKFIFEKKNKKEGKLLESFNLSDIINRRGAFLFDLRFFQPEFLFGF